MTDAPSTSHRVFGAVLLFVIVGLTATVVYDLAAVTAIEPLETAVAAVPVTPGTVVVAMAFGAGVLAVTLGFRRWSGSDGS